MEAGSIEITPEVSHLEGEQYFLGDKDYGRKTDSDNFQNHWAWIPSNSHESVTNFMNVVIKTEDCSEPADDQNELVCARPSFEQSAHLRNVNVPFCSHYNSSPEEKYELPHSNGNLQDAHSLNFNTEQGDDWLHRICESNIFESGVASNEVTRTDYSGAFSGYDHTKCGTDTEIPNYYLDLSDIFRESYSFGDFLATNTNSPSESHENSTCYNISTPNSAANCSFSSIPSSGYYSQCSEETPINEDRDTDININVSYRPELFLQKANVSSSLFSAQNQTKTEHQTLSLISIADCNHLTERTVSQSSSTQDIGYNDSVPKYSHNTMMIPGRPLSFPGENDVAGMPKGLSEELNESSVCVLESLYSLNSHVSCEQSSDTSDGYHGKKGCAEGNTTKDSALQHKKFKVSRDSSLETIFSASSSLNESTKSGKKQKILSSLKKRVFRATRNDKSYASAKLLVPTPKFRSLATQNTSRVSNSSQWNINSKKKIISRNEPQKCLPVNIHDSFQGRQTPECSCNSADGNCFDTTCSVKANFNQKAVVSRKQLVVADRGNSHEKIFQVVRMTNFQMSAAPISITPQISQFAISPAQQQFPARSKSLTENNYEILPRPIAIDSVSTQSSKTVVPDSISPVQLHHYSKPKNLTENKTDALTRSTATSSVVHVGKDTIPKQDHALNTPPPYIAVVKKSVLNSSKKQRQKTVLELLSEKRHRVMRDSLARQTIRNSVQLNSPVRFVTPLNEVSSNRRTVDSIRRPAAHPSTCTFNCDKQDCRKCLVSILRDTTVPNKNQPLTDVQVTASALLPATFQDASGTLTHPSASCSVFNNTGPSSTLSKDTSQEEIAIFKEKSKDTLPPFTAGRVRSKEHRPRHYDMMYLQIGNFYVSGQESPSGKIVSKFKIIFTKRYFTYEFHIPDSSFMNDPVQSLACIVVTFESVTAMLCDNNLLKIQVNSQPVTFLGSRQPRFGVISSANVFDTTKPVDVTNGEIMKCRVHEMQLRGHQAESVKKYLWNYDKRFKIVTQRSIRSSPSDDVGLLPSPDMDLFSAKKPRKKGISVCVRKPPWPFEVSDIPPQVCACRISCRSTRCSCAKAGQKCCPGRSICLCANCDNPLNVLHSMEIKYDMVVLDACLFQNVYEVPFLRQFLAREVILGCCQSIRQIGDCIPGVISCPNSTCGELIQYSWCTNTCCVIRQNPPNHCAVCGQCRFNNMRHCEECNKCYSTDGNSRCPKC